MRRFSVLEVGHAAQLLPDFDPVRSFLSSHMRTQPGKPAQFLTGFRPTQIVAVRDTECPGCPCRPATSGTLPVNPLFPSYPAASGLLMPAQVRYRPAEVVAPDGSAPPGCSSPFSHVGTPPPVTDAMIPCPRATACFRFPQAAQVPESLPVNRLLWSSSFSRFGSGG